MHGKPVSHALHAHVPPRSPHPLQCALSEEERLRYLMKALDEQSGSSSLSLLRKFCSCLASEELWQLLEAAKQGLEGGIMVADGSRTRSAGGIFIKLAKKRWLHGKSACLLCVRVCVQATCDCPTSHNKSFASAQPPGRLADKKKEQAPACAPSEIALRPYQQITVDRIWASGGANWVVSAPTNAGKTAIFVQLAK
jgi:hypothetical protein